MRKASMKLLRLALFLTVAPAISSLETLPHLTVWNKSLFNLFQT